MIQVSSSIIRKITRGTSSANGDVTISCSITDTNKVIVLLDVDGTLSSAVSGSSSSYGTAAGAGNVYLKSVSASNIVVSGHGITSTGYSGSRSLTTSTITFSYQIIEFM